MTGLVSFRDLHLRRVSLGVSGVVLETTSLVFVCGRTCGGRTSRRGWGRGGDGGGVGTEEGTGRSRDRPDDVTDYCDRTGPPCLCVGP